MGLRRSFAPSLAACAALLISGCLGSVPPPPAEPGSPEALPRSQRPADPSAASSAPASGGGVAQTEKRIGGAVVAPLHDVNLVRTKIPPVLLDAIDAPYRTQRPITCRSLAEAIAPLDAALGRDLDQAESKTDPSLVQRSRTAAGDAAVDAVKGAAESVIPMRGWVRELSGAEQHDRLVRAAIEAGAIRRGYLKGLGESLRCPWPGAPKPEALSAVPGASRERTNETGTPRYPISDP